MDSKTEQLPIAFEFSTSIKPKLTRTSASKVRTGCITCKKRHVKCDEAKPQCRNCVRNNRQCEGYVIPDRKRGKGPGQIQWDSKQITRAAPLRTQLHLVHDSLDFQDAQSVLYFDEFLQVVQSPWIAAGFNSDLWAVTLPQVARTNDIVRHAAIAIGALSKWFNKSRYDSLGALLSLEDEVEQEDPDYLNAVAHYCHALKLQSQQPSIQDAVFLSVLFLCFETLRGNRKAALDHINHGLAMLLALVTDPDSWLMTSVAPNPKPLIAAVADIFSQILPQTRLILRGTIGRSPAVPNFTRGLRAKKQSLESFMSLINQLPRSYPPAEELPPVLGNLDDFEKYWLTGRNAKLAVVPLLMEAVQNTGVLVSSDPDIISKVWKEITADPRIKEICEASTKELQALEAAFMPLFNRIVMSDSRSTDYIRAIHLRLHYLGTCTFDDLTHFYDVEPIQAKTPLFREFLSLAEISIRIAKRDLRNPAQQLSLQCSMASHLFLISLFCRDALLRDEATWMLRDYPGQDGIWNSRSLYLLAHRNKTVERINASEGTAIEQWHRLLRREYLFEEGGDRVVLCYLDKDEVTGEWQLVEETADVKGDLDAVEWKRRPPSAAGRPLLGDVIMLWPEMVE
ncbi:transcription factor [Fusarium beomiforme]|uniref:Transcription factor n=1 Tax=Fusarium beomiforme TaxID=44412 RepID=A0A9P5AU59_9HYPO|nr:transcription factor [Fusarium beomiforme]